MQRLPIPREPSAVEGPHGPRSASLSPSFNPEDSSALIHTILLFQSSYDTVVSKVPRSIMKDDRDVP